MAFIRFRIDGAIPKTVYDTLPIATKTAIRDKLLYLKALCRKINEEDTVRFKYHICHHDESPPTCEPEQDI